MGEEMHSVSSEHMDLRSFNMTSRPDSPYTPAQVDKLKRHLKFHFMTPCEKYKARGRKPWKLLVQILKIVVVTIQVFSLAIQRTDFVDFQHKTRISLEHILFKKWDASYETLPYPPATGKYALYKVTDIEEHLNYAMVMYNQTEELAIGAYGYPDSQANLTSKTANLKLVKFNVGKIFPGNVTYVLDPKLGEANLVFTPVMLANGSEKYDISKLLSQTGQSLSINRLQRIELSFLLNAIHIKESNKLNPFNEPDCLLINATVLYDNGNHDGQMLVEMNIHLSPIDCYDGSEYEEDSELQFGLTMLLDIVVVLLCFISFLTCFRSIKKSIELGSKTKKFFIKHYGHAFTMDDQMLFINLWFAMIMVSDLLTLVGTGLKMAITLHKLQYYDYAGMVLGIAMILIWMGVMRYFEYFPKYNVLVLTCKKAFPDVLRFLICASIVYIAFTICGWLVLGPYHTKFKSIATSSECLFSLVNGDDMFVTFSVIDGRAPASIWFFSRVYLYTFISLFIYFVLNVFISVIIDTYEAVKQYSECGYPKAKVELFMASCLDDAMSSLYSSDTNHRRCISSCCCLPACLRSCVRRQLFTKRRASADSKLSNRGQSRKWAMKA